MVIGANAVGKSTLIDCLQLIAHCCDAPLNTAFSLHYGAGSILTSGDVNKQLAWNITFHDENLLKISRIKAKTPMVYEAVLGVDSLGLTHPKYEVLKNKLPGPGNTNPFKYLEATPYRRQIFDKGKGRLTPFDEAQPSAEIVRDSNVSEASHGAIQPQGSEQEAALLLSQIRFFNEFPVPSAVRFLLANMAFYPGFDVTQASSLRTKPAEITPMTTLSTNGHNLGAVLHEIQNRFAYHSVAEELNEFLRAAYPMFSDVRGETTHGAPPQVLVAVREVGVDRSLYPWDLSDGVLRFLCLATALLNPRPGMLIAIDEPELGLHPGLLPVVAEMIKTAAERTQVLVTTHSPDLLDCFDIADVAVMARDEDDAKVLWHRPANRNTLVEMLKNVTGETLGDLLRSGELEAGA